MKRAFRPIALAALCWLLVVLVPATRNGLRRAGLESNRRNTDLATPFDDEYQPGEFEREALRRFPRVRSVQIDALTRPGVNFRVREKQARGWGIENDPTVLTLLLRARINGLKSSRDEGVLSNPNRNGTAPEHGIGDDSPRADWDAFLTLARRGQKAEPNNTFFDWMIIYALYGTRRDTEARAVLQRAARKTGYDDHSRDLILGRLKTLKLVNGGPLSLRESNEVWAVTSFVEYGKMRQNARWIMEGAIADRAQSRHTAALDAAFDLVKLSRIMRRGSYSFIGSLVGTAMEAIALKIYSPATIIARRQRNFVPPRLPNGALAPIGADSLVAYAQNHQRPDIAAFATRELNEMTRWRRLIPVITVNPDWMGNSTAQIVALAGAERFHILILRALPAVLVLGALFGWLARRFRDDSGARDNGFWRGAWCAGALLPLALGLDLLMVFREGSWRAALLFFLDSRGLIGSVPSWVTMGIAGITALVALDAATGWQKHQAAPPISLRTRLQTAFDAPEDGLMRFDFSWIFALVARSTGWLLLLGAFASVCFDVGSIGRNFGFDVANVGDAMMGTALLLSLFLHLRAWWSLPRRRAALRLGGRLIAQSMLGFFVCASVLYALVSFGFLPLAFGYERNFNQAMQRGEVQVARAKLGI